MVGAVVVVVVVVVVVEVVVVVVEVGVAVGVGLGWRWLRAAIIDVVFVNRTTGADTDITETNPKP